MKRSIGETAKLLNISIRTLRYYDEIGLAHPAEISPAGYRFYDEAAISRLQQVLFFRELEFPLRDIADILSRPDYDTRQALSRRKELLLLERRRLDELIALADKTLGGIVMKPEKKTAKNAAAELEAIKAKYASEAAERWGKTDAYQESAKRQAARDASQEAAVAAEADEIFASFAAAMDQDPASSAAQALVQRWRDHLNAHYYPCSKEMLSCLGQMYVQDARFTENLDRYGDGNARFISDAIACYCSQSEN